MKIGLQINRFSWPGGDKQIASTLDRIVTTADNAGFYSLWVMDHFFQIGNIGKPEEPMLESYTTLGHISALTKKARLGTMVTGVIYRQPALLVKAVTTLDVLSGGRAYLGIGAAWNKEESDALGFNFPSVRVRFGMLEEALQIAQAMWSETTPPFKGSHYHLGRTLNSPRPLTRPHPPILIGGMGEQKTLRLVARYADACNLFARAGDDILAHKLEVLKKHCQDIGRDYDQIEKTALSMADGKNLDPDKVIAECRRLSKMGFTHIIYGIPGVEDVKPLEIFGTEIIPAVATL